MRPVPGRLQFKTAPSGAWIVDDSYNANPSSMKAGIEVLAGVDARRWLVMGDMGELGDMAVASHGEIGRFAREQHIDRLFATGKFAALAVEAFGAGAQWFADTHDGLVWGFGIIFLISFMAPACNALIGYSMRRMSVSPVFAYSYIAIYSVSAIPGMLLAALLLFVLPVRLREGEFTLSWAEAVKIDWGTIILFGTGLIAWTLEQYEHHRPY